MVDSGTIMDEKKRKKSWKGYKRIWSRPALVKGNFYFSERFPFILFTLPACKIWEGYVVVIESLRKPVPVGLELGFWGHQWPEVGQTTLSDLH